MLQERDMVNDILSMTKASSSTYTTAIHCCSNQQLRTILQQLRNEAENFQYQLYEIANQKGYYQPAKTVEAQERQQIKQSLSQNTMS
ncbi:spore coat protein [Abyssisolibacter fermentans]|uniref:spore coat protein n=1 Tax=Abyssisolibacter fermentans TaxID=1766203 RepID=UPI000834EC88|nr:spore coat protein [Abyssisolibacter fermentans]